MPPPRHTAHWGVSLSDWSQQGNQVLVYNRWEVGINTESSPSFQCEYQSTTTMSTVRNGLCVNLMIFTCLECCWILHRSLGSQESAHCPPSEDTPPHCAPTAADACSSSLNAASQTAAAPRLQSASPLAFQPELLGRAEVRGQDEWGEASSTPWRVLGKES